MSRILEEAQTIVSDALASSIWAERGLARRLSFISGQQARTRMSGVTRRILPDASEFSVRNTPGEATMSKQTRVTHPIYNLLPTEIEGFDSLAELALDMRWSWNHATDEVWRQLDPKLWEITHNPWVVLQTVSRDQIERLMADPVFRKKRRWPSADHAASGGVASVVSTEPFARSPDLRRLFQHGIYVERSLTYLLGRAWQCSW